MGDERAVPVALAVQVGGPVLVLDGAFDAAYVVLGIAVVAAIPAARRRALGHADGAERYVLAALLVAGGVALGTVAGFAPDPPLGGARYVLAALCLVGGLLVGLGAYHDYYRGAT